MIDNVDIHECGPSMVAAAFANQVAYCLNNGAPITARLVAAVATVLNGEGKGDFLNRVRAWQGAPIADALALRIAGGLHALHLSGAAPTFAPIYADEAGLDDAAIIADVIATHEAALLPWLDSAPQTNEAGRSSNYIAAMLWLAGQGATPNFDCIEIGSSAGINLMIDRYHYNLAGVTVGPNDSTMRFAPEWRGAPPPDVPFSFAGLRGSDIAPVDLTDPAQALRLKAYIWPEHHVRFARMDHAIAYAHAQKPGIAAMNAADFVEAGLARPQASGTMRLLMHSIVWQYVPADQRARVIAAMDAAGARATAEHPLAWVALEANRTVHHHELVVRYWNGGQGDGAPHKLAHAHAHGAWVEWLV
ncbi:MAG: DUF2332 domain-containing protein [Sphingopyxis sp.]